MRLQLQEYTMCPQTIVFAPPSTSIPSSPSTASKTRNVPAKKLLFDRVKQEQFQLHETRKKLYLQLQKLLGLPIVALFTSFRYPVMLEDGDANMLEAILQESDLSSGLCLVVSSPGGDGLAAERIINLCRSYSGTRKFTALVPAKAKSAATMVCLGAEKIIMGMTSELGAIDPQLLGGAKRYSVYRIVESYKKLFGEAVKTKGNMPPYIQQLDHYDPKDIAEYESALETSTDIAIKALKSGMLSGVPEKKIERQIDAFLRPKAVKTHGRPIYADDAMKCGLTIDKRGPTDTMWPVVYELFFRLDNYVSTRGVAKCIESKDYSYIATAPMEDENNDT